MVDPDGDLLPATMCHWEFYQDTFGNDIDKAMCGEHFIADAQRALDFHNFTANPKLGEAVDEVRS